MKTTSARRTLAIALLAVLGWGTARAADPNIVREYTTRVALDVNTDGQVAKVVMPAEVPAALAIPTQEAAMHWRFEPPKRNGQAVTARTYAYIRLQVLKRSDSAYGLRVIFDANGPELTYTEIPRYPSDELRRRNEGLLTMDAVVRADGSLSDINLAGARYRMPPHAHAFEQSVRRALAHVRAQPELVDGKPVATRIRIPFAFSLGAGFSSWYDQGQQGHENTNPSGQPPSPPNPIGQAVAVDSPVRPMMAPGS